MTALLARWTEKLAGGPQAGTSDSPPLARVMGVGRQQHDTVTLAKQLLWEHYSDNANLGKNTARRSKYRHVEDIVDGIRKFDEHFSGKTQLPVIFVASDMINLPEARRKPENQTPKSSAGNSLESRLEILENQMVKVLMETKRAETVDRQSGNQPRPYSSVIRGDRQPDVKQQIIPGIMHPGSVTRAVHGDTISAVTLNQFLERRNQTRTYRHSRDATLSLYLT